MSSSLYSVGKNVLVKQSKIGEYSFVDNDSIILNSEIGEYCDIEKRNLIRASVVGDMSYTGADTNILWSEVGKYCCISRMVDIGGNEHNIGALSMMPDYRFQNRLNGKIRKHPDENIIVIGNDVWIGQGVSIVRKPDLIVGNGAVIGAGAVVTKSIPPYSVVAGVPARIIKYRFSESIIERLLKICWWNWPKEKIAEKWSLLSKNLTMDILDQLEEDC